MRYKLTSSNEDTEKNVALLEQGWDWPIAGCLTLAQYVNKIQLDTSRRFFWVYEDELIVGLFGFSLHPDFKSFQTGTFIDPQHRGRGINNRLKQSAIAAFQSMQLPLIATVLEENSRSLAAMRKVSGEQGQKFWEGYRQTSSYFFDLSLVSVPAHEIDLSLFSEISTHVEDLKNIFSGSDHKHKSMSLV